MAPTHETATSQLEQIAHWVVTMDPADAPDRLDDLLAAQVLSTAAATLSGRHTDDGQAVLKVLRKISASKRLPLPGGGTGGVLEVLDAATSWSMAQDYDDYLFMGHTGHSAVWVPLIVGAWQKSSVSEVKAAMLIANELGGRLGCSLVFGPHNGQMWAPIHRIASAAATARLLGLSEEQTTHAMAIALYEANDPVFHGFMGPGGKIRSASTSIVAGTQAALLAGEGLTGAPDILEHPRGFWARFSFFPLRGTFRGLGTSWVLDTLAIKPVPGCAYVDTTVEALETIKREYAETHGETLEPFMVDRVKVEASALTVGMDALSREAAARGLLSPVVVNFSIPLTVAAQLELGELTGRSLTQENLDKHRDAIVEIADHVQLVHDPSLTIATLNGINQELNVEKWLQAVTWRDLRSLRSQAQGAVGADIDRAVFKRGGKLDRGEKRYLLRRFVAPALKKLLDPLYGYPGGELPLEDADFRNLRLNFPARVTVVLRSGERLTAGCDQPEGSPGPGDQLKVAQAKWQREAAGFCGKKEIKQFADAVTGWSSGPKELLDLIA